MVQSGLCAIPVISIHGCLMFGCRAMLVLRKTTSMRTSCRRLLRGLIHLAEQSGTQYALNVEMSAFRVITRQVLRKSEWSVRVFILDNYKAGKEGRKE